MTANLLEPKQHQPLCLPQPIADCLLNPITNFHLPPPLSLSLFSYVISAVPLPGPLSSHYVIITQLSSKSSLFLALWRQKWKREWTERAKQRADERNGPLAWCCAEPLSNTCHQDPTMRLRAQKHTEFCNSELFCFFSIREADLNLLVSDCDAPALLHVCVYISATLDKLGKI